MSVAAFKLWGCFRYISTLLRVLLLSNCGEVLNRPTITSRIQLARVLIICLQEICSTVWPTVLALW